MSTTARPLCPRCGAAVVDDQEWCLECGAARTGIHPPPDWRIALVIVALVVALVVAAFVVAVIRLSTPG